LSLIMHRQSRVEARRTMIHCHLVSVARSR